MLSIFLSCSFWKKRRAPHRAHCFSIGGWVESPVMRDARSTAAKEMFFEGLRLAQTLLLEPEKLPEDTRNLIRFVRAAFSPANVPPAIRINPYHPAHAEPAPVKRTGPLHCGICGDKLKTIRSRCKCSKKGGK